MSHASTNNLSINLTASDSDTTNTALSIGPIAVTAGQTSVSSEFTAPTGTALQTLGTLQIAVATGTDYLPASGDDGRISIPFVTQGTIPELAIAGPDSSVDEGEDVTFTITANNSTNVDIAIPVAIADHASRTNANFVDELTYYAHLASGSTTATLTIPTNSDTTAENDGVVSATIQADSGTAGYTIKSSSGTGYADVWDDDGPTPVIVSVTSKYNPS